jgi:CheY-like chemotaxis protein
MEKTDSLLKNVFRFTTNSEIKKRKGFIVVLNNPDTNILSKLSSDNFIFMNKIEDIRQYIISRDVRMVLIEISKQNYGFELIDWIRTNHPDLPVCVSVVDNRIKEDVEKNFPDIEVFFSKKPEKVCQDFFSVFGTTALFG